MDNEKLTLAELQEILLWQKLNKQLLELEGTSESITDECHKSLQAFCFENSLFSKVTSNSIIHDMQLSLISNFKDVFFVTIESELWTDLLMALIPGTYALSIEQALADGFDELDDLDRKHHLIKEKDDSLERDRELFKFVGEYMDMRESVRMPFHEMALEFHRLKSDALYKMMKNCDYKSCLKSEDNLLLIDFGEYKPENKNEQDIERVKSIYLDFCSKVSPIIGGGNLLERRILEDDILSLLTEKLEEKPKESIENFVTHEIDYCNAEFEMTRNFAEAVRNKITVRDLDRISICNTSPFFFIDNPLPLV